MGENDNRALKFGNIPLREKAAYGIGAYGKDAVYAIVAAFLMVFYTDGAADKKLDSDGGYYNVIFIRAETKSLAAV